MDIYRSFYERKETIMGKPRILNEKWALVGSPGWYDYGFADREVYSDEQLAEGQFRFATWQDKKYIDWKASDQAVSQKFFDQLKKDIDQVADYNIIMMTHIATHPEFVVPLPHRLYDYMNAYLGASSYASLFENEAIKINVMGHVHMRMRRVDKGIQHIMACLGHYNQWLNPDDPEAELQNTLKVLTL
jgi:putative phosphoesterase